MMIHRSRAAAFVAAAVLVAGNASAQNQPVITLTPASAARWDIAAQVGWLAARKSDDDVYGNDSYDAGLGGVTVGRYLTRHLKADVQAAFHGEGRLYRQEYLPNAVPPFRSTEHHLRTATAGAGLSYQFFDNQWFHPYLGGGFEVLREEDRVVTIDGRLGAPATVSTSVSYAGRPFVATGFKWYVSERAFVGAGVRGSFSSRDTTHVAWTLGVGADL
jgi:opacity protein-like surface antigen